MGPSASVRDELSEAAVVTAGTTPTPPMLSPSAPPMLPSPRGPPTTVQPIQVQPVQVTDTSTSSVATRVQVPSAGGLAGGGEAPLTADQRMELELAKIKREAGEHVPAERQAKRSRSPVVRLVGSVPLGVGVPLHQSAAPLPVPALSDVHSLTHAIQHFVSGPSSTQGAPTVVLTLPTPGPAASYPSYEEL